MNDSTDRLRSIHHDSAGQPDDVRALDQIHDRIAATPSGSATRKRRALWTGGGLVGAVGAGTVLAFALGQGPGGPGPSGVRDGVIAEPSQTSTAADIQPAAWYANQAAEAVDLTDAIVQMDNSGGFQHPGETALDSSATREYQSADGKSSRWINMENFDSDIAPTPIGEEDDKYVNDDGTYTYVYVSPSAGVYTVFHSEVLTGTEEGDLGPPDAGTIDEQGREHLAEIRSMADEMRELEADPTVTQGEAVLTEIDGTPVTCFEFSSDTPSEPDPGGLVTYAWTSKYCFDDATQLPRLVESTSRYQVPDMDGESLSAGSTAFTWHENTEENRSLLQPSTDGLREVGFDEYQDSVAP